MREEERVHCETELMKELSLINKIGAQNFSLVEKHFRKIIRKVFVLTLDKNLNAGPHANHLGFGVSYARSKTAANSALPSLPLSEALPSHLHLAAVMGERTQFEKETFGKLTLESGQSLTEDKVDWAI